MPRIYAVMVYGGRGIAFSRIPAELVATALRGDRDRAGALFAFPGRGRAQTARARLRST